MVRHAFSLISDIPTRLICFSDDMDGFRKVPDNVPDQEKMEDIGFSAGISIIWRMTGWSGPNIWPLAMRKHRA